LLDLCHTNKRNAPQPDRTADDAAVNGKGANVCSNIHSHTSQVSSAFESSFANYASGHARSALLRRRLRSTPLPSISMAFGSVGSERQSAFPSGCFVPSCAYHSTFRQVNDKDATLGLPLLHALSPASKAESSKAAFDCLHANDKYPGMSTADPCGEDASAKAGTLASMLNVESAQGPATSCARWRLDPLGMSGSTEMKRLNKRARASPAALQAQPRSPSNQVLPSRRGAKSSQSSEDDPALTPPRLTKKPAAETVQSESHASPACEHPALPQHCCTEHILSRSVACESLAWRSNGPLQVVSMPAFQEAAPVLRSPDDKPPPVRSAQPMMCGRPKHVIWVTLGLEKLWLLAVSMAMPSG
jgi:hypothetical protein